MPKGTKRKFRRYIPIVSVILVFTLVYTGILLYRSQLSLIWDFLAMNQINPTSVAKIIKSDGSVLKQYQGRTNIALFGTAGGSHDGSNLTDSILFLSINYHTNDTLMVSIPRDLWMETLKDKINSAYAYGESKRPGGGLILAKSEVSEVVGVPVHYGWVIDFSGFQSLIDRIGGIDIIVEEGFTDTEFPIPGKENDGCDGDPELKCRYETITFEKGMMHMDGQTALKYVRSRHAEGDQGTDFARGTRQQVVLVAIRDKVMKEKLWSDPMVLKEFAAAFDTIAKTDMGLVEKLSLARFFLSTDLKTIRRIKLDYGNPQKNIKGFLENPPEWKYDGAWILLPRTGNFDEIHAYIECQLTDLQCSIKP